MSATAPNWAEQVVAIATGILALGVIGAGAAAVFGAQQVREARRSREAHMAAEFFRRWNEDSLVQSRRLVARFSTPEELASAFQRYSAADAPEAHVLYRELDYFEQLAALERLGAFDFTLIELLVEPHSSSAGTFGAPHSMQCTATTPIPCSAILLRA